MQTIKSSREIDELFKSSRRSSHPLVIALVAKTPPGRGQYGRVAFIAGRRMGGAVRRNRAKRRLREAARAESLPRAGYDVALIATARTLSASYPEIQTAVAAVLRRAGLS